MSKTIVAIATALLLAACTMAPPPDKQSAAAQKADEHTELRDAINNPINKAKAANDPNLKHDQDQQKAVDDQGG
jgi:PBP1b-binding outer membrane lipoprotein LpoB